MKKIKVDYNIVDKNSMDYWFTLVKGSGLPFPETVKIEVRKSTNLMDFMNRWPKDPAKIFTKQSCKLIKKLKYPLFLRSDQSSDKHGYDKTCLVETADDLMPHMRNIAEMNYMVDINPHSFYCRELLEVDSSFTCFPGKLPIGVEVRTFLYKGRVACIHPYWPNDAINSWIKDQINFVKERIKIIQAYEKDESIKMDDDINAIKKDFTKILPVENWQELLLEQYATILDESKLIHSMAQKLASFIHKIKLPEQYWSADFLRTRKGKWYLTDMALGQDSYHYPNCKRAEKYSAIARKEVLHKSSNSSRTKRKKGAK